MSDAIALLWPPFLVALALIGIHTYSASRCSSGT